MADFNPVFEIDAGAILTKLHLAGQSQCKNAIIINTAIKNPSNTATPDNPGKTEFDLENKTGEYELAVVRPLEYLVNIDPMKDKKYAKAKEDLDSFMKKNKDKLPSQGDGNKESNEKKDGEEQKSEEKKKEELDKNTSLTDDKAKDKTQVNASTEMKSFLDFLTEADDKDKKLKEELKEKQDALMATFPSFGIKDYKETKDDFNASNAAFQEALKKENAKRAEDKKKYIAECKKAAISDLKTYFLHFAGKDNQAKIQDKDIVAKPVNAEGHAKDPNDFNDVVKDYKIEVKEVLKKLEENEKNWKDFTKPLQCDLALAVGYKIDIE